jgi:mannose-1-phosphate guanylyltransferase / phosphomannomutase
MSKTRLTITISPEIVRQLDGLIDGKTIRNRSHAIEYLVNQQLTGQVSQAVILAGGSKAAIDHTTTLVAGQSILQHLINLLHSYYIHQIFIITDQPSQELHTITDDDPGVTIVNQPPHQGTAGALVAAKHLLMPSPILVLHGDIFTDINLTDLIRFHHDHGQEITLCVKPKLNQQEFGKAIMNGHKIIHFLNKPEKSEVGMVNTGVYLINPSVLNSLPQTSSLMLETDVFPKLAEQHKIAGFLFDELWYDISNKS